MMYLMDREQIRRAVFRGFGAIGNDQPIDPTNKYYMAGLPQRGFDPDKAKFHFQKAKLGSAPVQIVASPAADGSSRNGDAAPAGRAASRPQPAGDARARRRLLVESLDEASARLRQRSTDAQAPT